MLHLNCHILAKMRDIKPRIIKVDTVLKILTISGKANDSASN